MQTGEAPPLDDIRDFLRAKMVEKDIVLGYGAGLITEDEVILFLHEHVFTKFMQGKLVGQDADEESLDAYLNSLREIVFE